MTGAQIWAIMRAEMPTRTHKVQKALNELGVTHTTFAEQARCPRAVVSRAAQGMSIHARYVNRMVRAAGGRLAHEDFGPVDPGLQAIHPAAAA